MATASSIAPTTAERQPGSTFKLFVLHAALKAGKSPRDRIMDEKMDIEGWSPENFGGKYNGRVTIAEAFARSLNAATVALAQEVGIDKVAASARELGIDAKLTETPALALGASEVTLIDLTGAYASVRAGVAPVEPWGIVSFQSDQQRPFRVGPSKQPETSLKAIQNDLVGLLNLVVERGTGREARLDGFAAGKTGTSQNHRDAWFVGFTEPLVAGVWVGNDDGSPMRDVTGGKLPAMIWRNFMTAAMAELSATPTQAGTGRCVRDRLGRGRTGRVQCARLLTLLPLVPPLRLHVSTLPRHAETLREMSGRDEGHQAASRCCGSYQSLIDAQAARDNGISWGLSASVGNQLGSSPDRGIRTRLLRLETLAQLLAIATRAAGLGVWECDLIIIGLRVGQDACSIEKRRA